MAERKRQGNSDRGFAAMDEEKQREIASKGGKAAHSKGTAHQFTSEEARAAGRKGGLRSSGRSQTNRTRPQRDDDDDQNHSGESNPQSGRHGQTDDNREYTGQASRKVEQLGDKRENDR